MLTFTTDCTFQFQIVEIEPVIKDAKGAVCKLFGVSDPIELFVERQRPSFKEVLSELNPIHLLSPKHIPWRAIVPSRNDNIICLCLEVVGEFLQVGLTLETTEPAIAKIKKNSEEIASIINLISDVCKSYLSGIPFPKDYISSLSSLLALVRTENIGLVTGERLYKL